MMVLTMNNINNTIIFTAVEEIRHKETPVDKWRKKDRDYED